MPSWSTPPATSSPSPPTADGSGPSRLRDTIARRPARAPRPVGLVPRPRRLDPAVLDGRRVVPVAGPRSSCCPVGGLLAVGPDLVVPTGLGRSIRLLDRKAVGKRRESRSHEDRPAIGHRVRSDRSDEPTPLPRTLPEERGDLRPGATLHGRSWLGSQGGLILGSLVATSPVTDVASRRNPPAGAQGQARRPAQVGPVRPDHADRRRGLRDRAAVATSLAADRQEEGEEPGRARRGGPKAEERRSRNDPFVKKDVDEEEATSSSSTCSKASRATSR